MSTTDPLHAAHTRLEGYRGSTRAALLTVLWGILVLAAGATLAYAFSGLFNMVRASALNSIFSDTPDGPLGENYFWFFPIGFIGSFLAFALHRMWGTRFTGTPFTPVLGTLTIALIGWSLAAWYAASRFVQPDQIGMAVDPTFGRDETWGVWAWIMFAGRWWWPGIITALCATSLIIGVVSRAHRRRRDDILGDLLTGGRRTSGVITSAPTPSPDAARVLGRLTIQFTDAAGTQRWIQPTVRLERALIPTIGSPVTVLLDPLKPGDTRRIFWSFGPGTTREEFTQHTV
ncbi:hypothetical protein M2390_003115 [Mycetocola sp. BIGb0189]|uniref:hypothetical protein n=1 Tax=Mycetocola sp. BIGb0189 TaxID=2940604 RepID=UPI002167D849|nr:hypothetical protein [Mycetocola sp. BIGb0189]MCS4277899.1 hypothetical protein [Mycetocola sp. BIGb0189]